MKQCPTCQHTYTDERLAYCLEDGTALIEIAAAPNAFQPPPAITQPSSPRVKYTPSDTMRVPPGQFTVPYSQPTVAAQKSGKGLIIAAVAVVFLLIVGGVAAFLLLSDKGKDAPVANTNTNLNGIRPIASLTPVSTPVSTPAPTATQLVGSWRTNVVEQGVSQEINVKFNASGQTEYFFRVNNKVTGKSSGTWRYSDGTLFETFSDGASGKGAIKWIDDDTFDITIIDNGIPAYNGIVRRYKRIS
jgi:hypothetical protein